jgi:flagellar basal-body rod protein FlgF
MSTGIWSAASGAVSRTFALDVAANNVSNASTPGFRADRSVFRQEMVRAMDGAMGTQSMRYATTRSREPDNAPGQLVATGRPLDVALTDSESFFVVQTAQGQRYTRAGNLQVTPQGKLTTTEGYAYLGEGGSSLEVPSDAKTVAISPSGELVVDGVSSGMKLSVVKFNNPGALEKEGDVLMRATRAAGAPSAVEAEVETETLEMSNASALRTMTTLVNTTREFEMLARVIEAFSNVEHKAATEVG